MKQAPEQRDMIGDYPVKYIHLRNYCHDFTPHNMGGVTIAYIEHEGFVKAYAIAICSTKDNFERKIGRDKSRGRLNSPSVRVIIDENVTSKDFFDAVNTEWKWMGNYGNYESGLFKFLK
jgi:hypothetical protein